MSGHTEGPWEYIDYAVRSGGVLVCIPEFHPDGPIIAASPKMLAALRGLMGEAEDRVAALNTEQQQYIRKYGEHNDSTRDQLRRWQAVIDAVYLATGEVP